MVQGLSFSGNFENYEKNAVTFHIHFFYTVVVSPIDTIYEKGLKPFERRGFISPKVCGQCHDGIFDMWEGTMHAGAFDDPLFRGASKLLVNETEHPGELKDAEHCVSCHNPIAFRSGQIKGSSDDYRKTDEVTKYAVSCDLCHSINEIVMTMNAMFN